MIISWDIIITGGSDYSLQYNHSPLYFSLGYIEGSSEGGSDYILVYNHSLFTSTKYIMKEGVKQAVVTS